MEAENEAIECERDGGDIEDEARKLYKKMKPLWLQLKGLTPLDMREDTDRMAAGGAVGPGATKPKRRCIRVQFPGRPDTCLFCRLTLFVLIPSGPGPSSYYRRSDPVVYYLGSSDVHLSIEVCSSPACRLAVYYWVQSYLECCIRTRGKDSLCGPEARTADQDLQNSQRPVAERSSPALEDFATWMDKELLYKSVKEPTKK